MNSIIIISSRGSGGVKVFSEKLKAMNKHIILLTDRENDQNEQWVDQSYFTNFESIEKLKATLSEIKQKIDLVVNAVESLMPVKIFISKYFNINIPNEMAISVLSDKSKLRGLCKKHQLFAINYLSGTLDIIKNKSDKVTYPAILKPSQNTGATRDVNLINSKNDLYNIISKLKVHSNENFIIEEKINGIEFCLDGYVSNTNFTAVYATEKIGYDYELLREGECFQSPPISIPLNELLICIKKLDQLFKKLEINLTWMHIELRYDKGVFNIIEINPRVGGRQHRNINKLLSGIDPIDAMLGFDMNINIPTPKSEFIYQDYFIRQAVFHAKKIGIVKNKTPLENLLAIEGVKNGYIMDQFPITNLEKENVIAEFLVIGENEKAVIEVQNKLKQAFIYEIE